MRLSLRSRFLLLLLFVAATLSLPNSIRATQVNIASSYVNLQTSSNYTLSAPREFTANYTYHVYSDAPTYQLSLYLIQPFPYIHLHDVMILTNPTQQFTSQTTSDSMGNIFLTIDFEGQNSSSLQYALFYVTVLQHFTAYAITYNVNPLKIGAYDNSSSLYKLYTSSVPYIQSNNPEIVAKAKEIAQGDTNPYRVAYKIHNWVYSHMTYDLAAVTPYSPATEGALFALHSGKGVCRHYAALFTALARADGIPTANLFGSALTDNGSVVDKGDSKHGWVQFFIPNYGWISDDPTWSEFARLDNNHAPMMATNYTYQVAWSPDPGVFDQVLNSNLDEPVISLGIQVAEFPVMAPLTLVLVMAVTLWSINSKRNLATRK